MALPHPEDINCLCGSNQRYSNCCGKVHEDHKAASTAEMLMRSRYTAFVLENSDHVLRSWIEKKRPASLNFKDYPVTWVGLTIHNTTDGAGDDTTGTVDFTSTYLEQGQLCCLNEVSEFIKVDGLWYYVDGICEVTQKKVERNRPCPCGSGKKFKRCCAIK